jgi:hypothetical protein
MPFLLLNCDSHAGDASIAVVRFDRGAVELMKAWLARYRAFVATGLPGNPLRLDAEWQRGFGFVQPGVLAGLSAKEEKRITSHGEHLFFPDSVLVNGWQDHTDREIPDGRLVITDKGVCLELGSDGAWWTTGLPLDEMETYAERR